MKTNQRLASSLALLALAYLFNTQTSTALAQNQPLQYNGDYQGGRLIYDPNKNITWYQITNTSSIRYNWRDSEAWAASLSIAGVTGWRLPAAPEVADNGNQMVVTGNADDGELGYLWYDELNNHAGALTNTGPFDATVWQSTAVWTASGPWYGHTSGFAVYFSTHDGNYGLATIPPWTPGLFPALAVFDGDVGPGGVITVPPKLFISQTGNSITLFWATNGNWTLLQNANIASADWTTNSSWITSNGTNSLTMVNPTGNLYFRLKQ